VRGASGRKNNLGGTFRSKPGCSIISERKPVQRFLTLGKGKLIGSVRNAFLKNPVEVFANMRWGESKGGEGWGGMRVGSPLGIYAVSEGAGGRKPGEFA